MAYWDVAQMSSDPDLQSRIAACAAQEGKPNPRDWAYQHALVLCASPGWDAAWASAVAGNVPDPGRDPGVITDGMILSAVQAQP
jgi:hypothetical protein